MAIRLRSCMAWVHLPLASLSYFGDWKPPQVGYQATALPQEGLQKMRTHPVLPSLNSQRFVAASACRRSIPPLDVGDDAELEVVNVTSIGEWTSVTFARWGSGNDASVSAYRQYYCQ